jgi:hypothetical protein
MVGRRDMTHPGPLRLQVSNVSVVRGDVEGTHLGHRDPGPLEPLYLRGIAGHQTNAANPELFQDLGGVRVVAIVDRQSEVEVRIDRVCPPVLRNVGA